MRTPSPIVCLEGPSAAGKTTLAAALARRHGAAVIAELSAGSPPPEPDARAAWFVDHHAADFQRARALAAEAPLVVLDGDPFKGLWYDRVFAEDVSQVTRVVAPLYRARLQQGALAFPDLSVLLLASEEQLRARRTGDASRSRRNFEKHLALVEPQRRYFTELARLAPGRVLLLRTQDPATLADQVTRAVAQLPGAHPDSLRLFDGMVAWLSASGRGK
jgi:thymidylate kinase